MKPFDQLVEEVLKRQREMLKSFLDRHTQMIIGKIIAEALRSTSNVIVYEVENFENLFDYAEVFSKLASMNVLKIFNRQIMFIAVTQYPFGAYIDDMIEEALGRNAIPFVTIFIGDVIPAETKDSSDYKDIMKALSRALFNKECYVVLFTSNPMLLYDNIPLARYGVVMKDFAPSYIAKVLPEKARYAKVVGFRKVLKMSVKELEEYLRKRRLPTPHTLEETTRDVTFAELVLPASLKQFLRVNVLEPLKQDFESIPSILLLGPAGAGKTTLAYTIARELGVTAYVVKVELIGSKWLGETERIANETLMLVNDMSPAVVIFRNAELILSTRETAGEESMVYERVRSIISAWLRSHKRRFFAVFTISDPGKLPEYILHDATFGLYKLPILPPLTKHDRKLLLTRFLDKYARIYGLRFDPMNESVDEALDYVAEETWAYTPRELQAIALSVANIVRSSGDRVVTKEAIQLARKFVEIDRVARVEIMKHAITVCKKAGVPEPLMMDIYSFETEIEKLKARALTEEARKKSFARLAR